MRIISLRDCFGLDAPIRYYQAVPVYTTDLTTINDAQSGTWTEPLGGTLGTLALADTDNAIQNTASTTKATGNTGYPATTGMGIQAGASQSITTPSCVYIWLYHGAPATMETLANGGYRVIVGQDLNNFKHFYVLGSVAYAYGGWVCIAVDPSLTADATTGTPSATLQYFGSMVNQKVAIGKGNPIANDAIRWGRTLQVVSGQAGNYATFTGAAAKNDANDATEGYNRWGQLQAIAGGYQLQGQLLLGTAATAVDFRDANTSVLIANNLKVAAGFNEIEIRNATSRVDWTSVSFLALGTVSRGNLVVTDNADVNIEGCTFTDMGTFGFLSGSTINNSTFRRCNLITQAGAVFDKCTIDKTNDSVKAMIASNPATISNCSFTSSGTKHAIEITTAGTYAFVGNSFFGYATEHGTTGNEVIYNNSGGAVTLNVSGAGVGTISYRNGAGATTTVASSASLVINIVDEDGTAITANSEVTVVKNSDTSILFEEDNVVDGTTTYSYSSGGGTVTYINVFNVTGYQPKTVNNYTLPSSGTTTLTIQLDTERFYANP